MVQPARPGALNVGTLTGQELVDVVTSGPQSAQATSQQIANLAVKARGTFVLNGSTPVNVAYAGMAAGTIIDISLNTPGGTVGAEPVLQTVTPGTGFSVAGTAADTSTYNWLAM